MPLVSVLIPVYNVEKYLSKCLESIIHQTYENIEIILINDGSTDSSADICRMYQDRYDFIHLYEYANAGISVTRNRALEKACGDYILFVDSDDFMELEAIEKMVSLALKEQADIVTCGYVMDYGFFPLHRRVGSRKKLTSLEALHSLVSNTGVNNYPWAKLYARSCFRNVAFPKELKGFEDTCTVFKAIHNANKVVMIPNRYYHYVQRRGSLTHHMDLETVYQMRKAYEYQEACLHRYYPNDSFSFDIHYFNTDMVILYTVIFFYSKKDHPVYVPANIHWSNINIFLRFAYMVWYSVAALKCGWSFETRMENRQ